MEATLQGEIKHLFKKKITVSALTCVAQLGVILQSEWLLVQFLVTAHVQVAGLVPSRVYIRGNQLMFLTSMFLSRSSSLSLFLKINK